MRLMTWTSFKISKFPFGSLKKSLTPLQFNVTQEDGTEKPFENTYWDSKKEGIYVDIVYVCHNI